MPFNNETGEYSRPWAFVDQYAPGDLALRSSFDAAFEDIADAMTSAGAMIVALEGAAPSGFASRAALVAAIAAGDLDDLPDGMTVVADGLSYKKQTGATVIADLPGLVPGLFASPLHFGAVADANILTGTGTDATAALDAWLAWLATGNVGLLDGFYRYVGQMDVPGEVKWFSLGVDRCGFLIEITTAVSGMVLMGSNCGDTGLGFTVSRNMTNPKTGEDVNNGHLGNVFRIGNYRDGVQSLMGGHRFSRLRLTDVQGSNSATCLGICGNVEDVVIDDLTVDSPNENGMYCAMQAHWSGDFYVVGDEVTETYHTRGIKIGRMYMPTGVRVGVIVSADSDVEIETITAKNLEKLFYIYPGDERDDFASGAQYAPGRGLKFGKITVIGTKPSSSALIVVYGVGSSKFRLDPSGGPDIDNLYRVMTIGQLLVRGYNNMNDCFAFTAVAGDVDIGIADIRGFNRYSAYFVNCLGRFRMKMNTNSQFRAVNSIGWDIDLVGDFEGDATSYAAYIFGEPFSRTTSGDVPSGGTSITITSPLVSAMPRGTILYYGKVPVVLSSYSAAGDTTLDITPAKVAIPSGETISIDIRCAGRIAPTVTRANYGVAVLNAQCEIASPHITRSGYVGISANNSHVTITAPNIHGSRTQDILTAGNARVSLVGGRIGWNSNYESLYPIGMGGTTVMTALGTSIGAVGANCRNAPAGNVFRSYGATDANGDLVPDANV
jgi:hypothetical protein